MSLTAEQLEQRLDYITGSDASVICGVSPWGNIVDLWRQKLRLTQAPDISSNTHVKAGNYLEPAVRQWFCDEAAKDVETDAAFIIHPNIPYMAGNIDGRIKGENAIFEAKTTARADNWGEQGEFLIPDYYLCQVAHYAACEKDCERAYIAVLIRGSDFRWYTYERNDKLEQMIIEKEAKFWDCIKKEQAPEPRNSDEVISLYGYQCKDEPVIADGDLSIAVDELRDTKAIIKDAQDKQKKLEDKIKVYMTDKSTLLNIDGKIAATWKVSKPRKTFDSKALELDNRELYEKYTKEGKPSRRFLLK